MSDLIKHECGIGLIRLFKPLEYYQETYGTALWGLRKMYLLMEKQRNRGQDGAGLGVVKLNVKPGRPYIERIRDNETNPWTNIFKRIDQRMQVYQDRYPTNHNEAEVLKQFFPYAGEVMLGHLRYGTHGSYGLEACHPVRRDSEYMNRSLILAGNFNLTNVDYLFQKLVELGHHPRYMTDTETVLERIGHFLDNHTDQLGSKFRKEGYTPAEVTRLIAEDLSPVKIMRNAANAWDGGYVIGGALGNGDSFVVRDPNGIRPCYYYANDEIFVAASERAAISTIFNLVPEEIQELDPGHMVSIKGGSTKIKVKPFTEQGEKLSCSFERIYFSRGSDRDIYQERKDLGKYVVPKVLESIDYDLPNTVFGFIPNTAESSFMGMMQEVEAYLSVEKVDRIKALGPNPDPAEIQSILNMHPRAEKVILKDVKMRTFIADDNSRDDLVSHVYDITAGVIRPGIDQLVAIDDSIVRGTTLKKSIIHMLARLKPKKIVIVSAAPQIRYPDCYGIDMSRIDRLVAFIAAVGLLRERGMEDTLDRVYQKILAMKGEGTMHERNVVSEIYAPFTEDEISAKITEIVRPEDLDCDIEIIYQPLENLVKAIPNHRGDWYFSGNYPTPGGNKIVNQAFLNFYEGKSVRAYQMGTA